MIKDTKQSWEECEYAVKCYETLTDYYTCINKQILDFKSYPTIVLRRRDYSLIPSAILFKRTYMTFEDRLSREKSETISGISQSEIDRRLACKVCKFYEPRAKFKQLTLDKKSSNKK